MSYEILSMGGVAKNLNNLVYTDYYYRLKLLAKSVFQWENLPNGIDESWIEEYLFTHGECVFLKDASLGLMVARVTRNGLNAYDEPTGLVPTATGHIFKKSTYSPKECVLIKNNDLSIPTLYTIQLFAYDLARIHRTIDTNIKALKTPVLIQCSEKQKKSLKIVYNQWDENQPVIWGDPDLDISNFKVLKTDAPIVFDKLQIQKHAIWNEAMTFLGINNANMDKRERLVDDEVQANNEQIELSASVMLKSRQRACDLINDMFKPDKSVTVKMRNISEIKKMLDETKEGDFE